MRFEHKYASMDSWSLSRTTLMMAPIKATVTSLNVLSSLRVSSPAGVGRTHYTFIIVCHKMVLLCA